MFIDEFYESDFYQKLGLNYANTFSFGQFFWTHAYYPHENFEMWRPDPKHPDRTETTASSFRIVSGVKDKFNHLPLDVPKLEYNEEFLVVRAKIRPVVLIQPELPASPELQRERRMKLDRKRCLVAQVFSLKDPSSKEEKVSREVVDRIRRLEYPNLMFLPEKAGLFEVDGVLKLDECQSVFTPHLQPIQYALGKDLQELLSWQLRLLFFDEVVQSYLDLKNLLAEN
jgi:hypothetical protein